MNSAEKSTHHDDSHADKGSSQDYIDSWCGHCSRHCPYSEYSGYNTTANLESVLHEHNKDKSLI